MPAVKKQIVALLRAVWESTRDLLPIVLVIAFFQLVVLQEPMARLGSLLWGTGLVVLGLTLFVRGLEMGLFPIGESMAYAFARKGSLWWLLAFAFALGFGTTVAEPALIAVAAEAAKVAAKGGMIGSDGAARTLSPPRARDATRHLFEEQVTGIVAKRVFHGLERVKSEKKDRH